MLSYSCADKVTHEHYEKNAVTCCGKVARILNVLVEVLQRVLAVVNVADD